MSDGSVTAMDSPATDGTGFSPVNMVEAALGGCMLMAMGTVAKRSEIDMSGVKVVVDVTMTDKPRRRFGRIAARIDMPAGLSDKDRKRLEAAAPHCPIKHSLHPDVPVDLSFVYPD